MRGHRIVTVFFRIGAVTGACLFPRMEVSLACTGEVESCTDSCVHARERHGLPQRALLRYRGLEYMVRDDNKRYGEGGGNVNGGNYLFVPWHLRFLPGRRQADYRVARMT